MASELSSTPQPALIFIPDISGFTHFVHTTEVSHSQHIIRELLETIVDANDLNMEISEIEGDAILFYRLGKAPDLNELLAQVKAMYLRFHSLLKSYEHQRICHCGACSTASQLKLKFVAHFGSLVTGKVKTFSKLFGKDLIVAHRLLKNSITNKEYLLVTKPLSDENMAWKKLSDLDLDWVRVAHSSDEYDFGKIEYAFIPLELLQEDVPEPEARQYLRDDSLQEMLVVERQLNAPLGLIFDVMSDLSFRHRWQVPLKDSTELNGSITKNGSTHRCVINGNDRDPFLISHSFGFEEKAVVWTDSETRRGFHSVFQLQEIGNDVTRIRQTVLANPNFARRIIFQTIIKPRLERQLEKSYDNLNTYLRKLRAAGEQHSTRIILPSGSNGSN